MQSLKVLELVADGRPSGGTTGLLALVEDLNTVPAWKVAFCSQHGSYAIGRADEMGVSTRGIDFFRIRMDPRVVRGLRRLINEFQPDIVHAHGIRAALPLTFALHRNERPFVYTVHGYQFHEKPLAIRALAIQAERRVSARALRTVFVCGADRDLAQKHSIVPLEKTQVIYNGIDPRDLPPQSSQDPRIVAFLGRLEPEKRPEMAIEVATALRGKGFKLWFIGGGVLEPSLRALTAERGLEDDVRFFGVLPREAALRQLSAAGLLIMPSRWEGFPFAPLEAMDMGIPVIAARVGGIPEIVEDGKTGFLIDRPDAAVYADRIERLAADHALRRRVSEAGRDFVLSNFPRSRTTAKNIELYESLIAGRHA